MPDRDSSSNTQNWSRILDIHDFGLMCKLHPTMFQWLGPRAPSQPTACKFLRSCWDTIFGEMESTTWPPVVSLITQIMHMFFISNIHLFHCPLDPPSQLHLERFWRSVLGHVPTTQPLDFELSAWVSLVSSLICPGSGSFGRPLWLGLLIIKAQSARCQWR